MSSYPNPYQNVDIDNEYYRLQNCLFEPSNIEKMQYDAFSYPISSKYVTASFATSLGNGRLEVRNPSNPLFIKNGTLSGLQSGAAAVTLNPITNYGRFARSEYYRRLNLLQTLSSKYLAVTAPSQDQPFVCGPYGTLMRQITIFDLTWIIVKNFGGSIAYNLSNELGDAGATDYQRTANTMSFLMTKGSSAVIGSGTERTSGAGKGGILYNILPKEWSNIDTLSTKYVFRDDFMGSVLDTSIWTPTQSTPGNIAIYTDFAAVKGSGTAAWGTNGMYSTASYQRSAGLRYVADAWVGSGASQTVFGLSDGLGVSYTNFIHGFSVSDSGIAYTEAGSFNAVAGIAVNTMYRLRVTPGPTKGALYEIQGGPVYPLIGDSSWGAIADTRSTGPSNSSFKIGYTPFQPSSQNGGSFLSDVRVY